MVIGTYIKKTEKKTFIADEANFLNGIEFAETIASIASRS